MTRQLGWKALITLLASATAGAGFVAAPSAGAATTGRRVVIRTDPIDESRLVKEPKFRMSGSVQSIGTSSFSLFRRGQTWSVDVAPSTTFRYYRGGGATFGDLMANEVVGVLYERTLKSGTVNALAVVIDAASRVYPSGFITSIGTNGFTMLSGHASVVVVVGDETHYSVPGMKDATFANLAVGDPVRVDATASPNVGTVSGDTVSVEPTKPHLVYGQVSSVGMTSFMIVHGPQDLTVDVSAGTQYFELTNASANFGSISTGETVLIAPSHVGTAGTVDANWILIFPQS